jgi:hypothetical protein
MQLYQILRDGVIGTRIQNSTTAKRRLIGRLATDLTDATDEERKARSPRGIEMV